MIHNCSVKTSQTTTNGFIFTPYYKTTCICNKFTAAWVIVIIYSLQYDLLRYENDASNTAEENSSVFSLIRMR